MHGVLLFTIQYIEISCSYNKLTPTSHLVLGILSENSIITFTLII